MNRRASLLLALSITVPLSLAAAGTPPGKRSVIDRTLDALFSVTTFDQVSISPDGKYVAYVQRLINKDGSPSSNSAIFVVPYGTSTAPTRITASGKDKAATEQEIAWSPDSSRLAFLSNAADAAQAQLYVSDATGSSRPRQLTRLKGEMQELRWAPDGTEIGFLFIENASRKGGALAAMTRDQGVVEEHFEEQRLAIVSASGGTVTQTSPADMYVYHFDWAPDGRRFVGTAAFGSGENNWWIAQLYTFDRQTKAARSIYKSPLQLAAPQWSPDGKSIAFIEGLMSDEGSTGGDVMRIGIEGDAARNLTEGMKGTVTSLLWTGSGDLLAGSIVNGAAAVMHIRGDGTWRTLWSGAEKLYVKGVVEVSASRVGSRSAAIRESFQSPPEIWAGPIGEWKQVTHANRSVKPMWGQAKNITWKSDNFDVQGWLLYPREFDPSRKYPMVVSVHGGPSSGALATWPSANVASLPASGYFVFYPNFRGSYGQGTEFQVANVKDFGAGDFRDILKGVDRALASAPIDPGRIGISGWSYGGYMTMWAVTQTNRFRAAVAGAGIVNWQSYYGQNSIDQWMIPFFGASVYDDPKMYAKSSPIEFIRNVKTPTLVLVGERDGEVPAPQSYEFWHALKTLRVDTQLVVYPDEGHKISNPKHRRDIARRIVGWFDRYLKEVR